MSLAILVIPLVSRSRRSASISYKAGSKNNREQVAGMVSSQTNNFTQLAGGLIRCSRPFT